MRKPRSFYVAAGKPYALPQCNSQRSCTVPGADTGSHDEDQSVPEFRFTPPSHREHAMSQGIGPFANLDESALRALAPHGAVRSFSKNAVVVSEGDETDSLYILLSGRVKAF